MFCDQIIATGFFLLSYCVNNNNLFGHIWRLKTFLHLFKCDIYIYIITYGYKHICLNAATLLC